MSRHGAWRAAAAGVLLLWPSWGWAENAAAVPPPAPAHDARDPSGTWSLDELQIHASSCPAALTAVVRDEIRDGDLDCTFVITVQDGRARVVEICPDGTVEFPLRLGPTNALRHSESLLLSSDGCRWWLINTVSADLRVSPTAMTVLYLFQFAADCGMADCAIEIKGRLQRVELTSHEPARARAWHNDDLTAGAGQ